MFWQKGVNQRILNDSGSIDRSIHVVGPRNDVGSLVPISNFGGIQELIERIEKTSALDQIDDLG